MNESTVNFLLCETQQDLFRPRTRAFIGKLARDWLNERRLTVGELLHASSHGRTLLEAGTRLSGIIQKAAVLQGQITSRPAGERVKEIDAIVSECIDRSQAIERELPFGKLTGAMLANALAAQHEPRRRATILVVREMAQYDGWPLKIECLNRIALDGRDPIVAGIVDGLLSEILEAEPALASILGTAESAIVRTYQLLSLLADYQGGIKPQIGILAQKLKSLLATMDAPQSIATLREQMATTIGNAQRIASSQPLEEFRALSDLLDVLSQIPDFGRPSVVGRQIDQRLNRLVTPEWLPLLLEGAMGSAQKLLRMAWIYNVAQGADARAEVVKYAETLLNHPDLVRNFIQPGLKAEERQGLFDKVRYAVNDFQIDEQRKGALLSLLDKYRDEILTFIPRPLRKPSISADDHVILNGIRLRLKNWSMQGLLFGPMANPPALGRKINIVVSVRSGRDKIKFEADAEVLRVAEGDIAVRYICKDPRAHQQIEKFFFTE